MAREHPPPPGRPSGPADASRRGAVDPVRTGGGGGPRTGEDDGSRTRGADQARTGDADGPRARGADQARTGGADGPRTRHTGLARIGRGIRPFLLPAALVLAAVWAWRGLDIDADRIDRAPAAARRFLGSMWPPDFSPVGPIQDALLETIQIAVLATILGTIISVPIGLVAARTLFPAWIATPVRMLATAVRVLPAILWAIFAVIIVGQGPLAGIFALTFYTIGYLTKLQSEAIEGIPRDALDAVRATGAPRYQQAWHVAIPEAANALRSQALFMFEYNVRNSSVLGVVAAGGIGVNIISAIQFQAFDRVAAYIIALFLTVVVIDALSYLVRRRYIELEEAPRARWRDVLWPRAPSPPS